MLAQSSSSPQPSLLGESLRASSKAQCASSCMSPLGGCHLLRSTSVLITYSRNVHHSGFPAHLILLVISHRWPFLMPGEQDGRCFLRECSVAQLCPTLCDPTDHNMPGFPVFHCLPEPAQTHVHQVGDAIQPSHRLSPPSPPALYISQHQGLFQGVG